MKGFAGLRQCLAVLVVFLISAAGQSSGSSLLNRQHHVVIGPATNLTLLVKGTSNIVVSWLPPKVYVSHDVSDPSAVAVGDQVTASQMKSHMSLVVQNKTDDSDNNCTSTPCDNEKSTSTIKASGNKLLTWLLKPWQPEEVPHWECRPFSFFANYTVNLRGKIPVDSASPVVQLKDSTWVNKKVELELKEHQAIVPFDEGCVENYRVVWQEVGEDGQLQAEQSMVIPPTVWIANITNLKANTTHKISVIAQFKTDKEISGHPVKYVKTSSSDATEECKCDWHGTVKDQHACNIAPNAKYCTCKPEYEGTFCERCAPGYYRSEQHFPCHKCPCNVHGTNRTTCSMKEGFLKCDKCEVGYTGSMCHVCAKGFYRYRKFCVPCHCNGNTLPGADVMCLPSTGMCRNCQHNTTGYHCERCLHGYVGDPFRYKNCTHAKDALGAASSMTFTPHKDATFTPKKDVPSSSSGISPGVIITITLLALLVVAAVGFILFRRYRSWKQGRTPAFWTVGMNPRGEAVDINSVHNTDARLDDDDDYYGQGGTVVDDVEFYEGQGGKSSNNKYLRLVEQA